MFASIAEIALEQGIAIADIHALIDAVAENAGGVMN
jgi:hypothetical protein